MGQTTQRETDPSAMWATAAGEGLPAPPVRPSTCPALVLAAATDGCCGVAAVEVRLRDQPVGRTCPASRARARPSVTSARAAGLCA